MSYIIESGAPSELRPKLTTLMSLLHQDDFYNLVSFKAKKFRENGKEKAAINEKETDLMDILKQKVEMYMTIKSFDWSGVDTNTIVNLR